MTDVAKLSAANDGFDGDVHRGDVFDKLRHGGLKVFVGVRVEVGLVELPEAEIVINLSKHTDQILRQFRA